MTTGSPKRHADFPAHVGRYILGGFFIIAALVGGIIFWGVKTNISGAVVTQGTVVVESSVKKVQHPTGGIVAEIYVKGGQKVSANELLIRLDNTLTRANLQVVTKQLDELEVRATRLAAERDGSDDIQIPEPLLARMDEPNISRTVKGESALFHSRHDSRIKQNEQLRERISQFREESKGIDAQIEAKTREIALIAEELKGLKKLEAKKLISTNRMVSMRREAARLEGERGQLVASSAKTKGMISEVELKILGMEHQFKSDVVNELRQVESKQSELVERRVAGEDQLKRIEIRAPKAGIVHQLSAHTVGGIINAGEPVMLIVPENDRLVVEARIAPQNIDQLHLGQPAMIRFSAFNSRTTPEVTGSVSRISADLSKDDVTGERYFLTRIVLPESELSRLGAKKIVPGMPADVQIRTTDRTALSYLIKPLQDQVAKAFRER